MRDGPQHNVIWKYEVPGILTGELPQRHKKPGQDGRSIEATDPQNGWSLFHFAAELQDIAAMEYSISSGCNPNQRDNFGQTSLHIGVDSDIDGAIQTETPLEYRATK